MTSRHAADSNAGLGRGDVRKVPAAIVVVTFVTEVLVRRVAQAPNDRVTGAMKSDPRRATVLMNRGAGSSPMPGEDRDSRATRAVTFAPGHNESSSVLS